ncbi:MAG: peptide chain release factor N(5)-glutamine methyltransferase [Solirubrobacterales bacterium]|nr:peptide chain release factor N(5)-glutamine methyltransferase [Solirubrobacterales bacterium]
MTVADALARAELAIQSSPNPDWRGGHRSLHGRSDARLLLADALGVSRVGESDLSRTLGGSERVRFGELVDRRVAGEPLAQILGYAIFRGLRVGVPAHVFVPRASSARLVEEAVSRIERRSGPAVVDVGTGTGAVALAVANEAPCSRVWALDIDPNAVAAARRNVDDLGLPNVTVTRSNLLRGMPSRLRGRVDMVTAHLPYVSAAAFDGLPRQLTEFEPCAALSDGSNDGLGAVRRLACELPAWLRPGGRFAIEISPELAKPTAAVLRLAGFADLCCLEGEYGTQLVVGRQPRARSPRRLSAAILIAAAALSPALADPAAANASHKKNQAKYDVLSAELLAGDHGLVVHGRGGCARGDRVFLTVTIKQGGRVARGAWAKHSCTGLQVPFTLTANATSGTFHKGSATSVCVSVWKRNGRTVSDARVQKKVTIT